MHLYLYMFTALKIFKTLLIKSIYSYYSFIRNIKRKYEYVDVYIIKRC